MRYLKKITQFVYYGKTVRELLKIDCYPSDLDNWKYNVLRGYGPVSHLGIQGAPGVKFYLNNSDEPITIGATGIYELNLEGIGHISALRFDMDVLGDLYDLERSLLSRVIVDIIYEGVK